MARESISKTSRFRQRMPRGDLKSDCRTEGRMRFGSIRPRRDLSRFASIGGDDLPSPTLPKAVTVPLEPGTIWGGVIRNEQDKPIPGVKVTVHYWESPVGNPQPHLRANIDEETTTDKDGRWRINVMPAEVVEDEPRIFLSHPDYVSDNLRRGMTPMPATKRPSVEALRAQTAVMVMRKGGVIQGRVIDEKGTADCRSAPL